jgi:hypothetical protein
MKEDIYSLPNQGALGTARTVSECLQALMLLLGQIDLSSAHEKTGSAEAMYKPYIASPEVSCRRALTSA